MKKNAAMSDTELFYSHHGVVPHRTQATLAAAHFRRITSV
jgi:hypothetical protein